MEFKEGRDGMESIGLSAAKRRSRTWNLELPTDSQQAFNEHPRGGLNVPYYYARTFFSLPRLKPSALLPELKYSVSLVNSSLPLLAARHGKEDVRWAHLPCSTVSTCSPWQWTSPLLLLAMRAFLLRIQWFIPLGHIPFFLGRKPWIQVQLAKLGINFKWFLGKNFKLSSWCGETIFTLCKGLEA